MTLKQEYLNTLRRLIELGTALGGKRQDIINDVIALSAGVDLHVKPGFGSKDKKLS